MNDREIIVKYGEILSGEFQQKNKKTYLFLIKILKDNLLFSDFIKDIRQCKKRDCYLRNFFFHLGDANQTKKYNTVDAILNYLLKYYKKDNDWDWIEATSQLSFNKEENVLKYAKYFI